MRIRTFLLFVLVVSLAAAALGGDSVWGTVTAVPSADVVVLSYGAGQFELHIIGIDVPPQVAERARQFVANLVLNKSARMRFEYRDRQGRMLVRLFTDDPALGIRDVAVELLRAGLARRNPDYDYKYGELAAAEAEARKAGAGIWAQVQ